MDIHDLLKNSKNLPSYELEKKLNKLARENYRFKNLSGENKELLLKLIKEYIGKIKAGYGVSSETIRRDMYELYQKREKMELTEEDLDDFREILNMFTA